MNDTHPAVIADSTDRTGERMMPEHADAVSFWEHIYRYRFAAQFVQGLRVLDLACGEGYGAAALLQAGAASVIGVDCSEGICHHARRHYGVDARPGSAECVPLPANSVEVVVSFETIEHLREPRRFLAECRRVLVPGGRLILSTPNQTVHREALIANPFHEFELTEAELTALLAEYSFRVRMFGQRPQRAGCWSSRSLIATTSFWLRLKGVWRGVVWLRSLIWRALCPHVLGEVDGAFRHHPVSAVLARDGWGSALVNPYTVRRRSRWSAEQPWYFIAVAENQ